MRKILTYIKCDLADLECLKEISKQTFIDAYEKDNNPNDFKSYINSAFTKKKLILELKNPNSEFYFIYLNSKLVGYFKINQNEAQSVSYGNNALELSRIYLLKEFYSQNIGKYTLDRIITMAKENFKFWIWLSVWQQNADAIRFYEKHEFKKFDTAFFDIGNDRQIDWLMRLDLV